MRLIDADALIKRFETIQKQEQAIGLDFVAIIDEIKEQQTAYDVDKVVKELEERKQEYLGSFVLHENNELYGVACGLGDAIEIVKNGGVSDDVCEWIKYDYRTICPKNHDANNPYWRIPDNTDKLKYCPYCGKKIKVVE